MAGPYHVASVSDSQVVLERNPDYTGNRPRRIARIVYTNGFTEAEAISRVEHGRADYVTGRTVAYDASGPLAPGGALDSSYGLASRAGRAGNARYLPSPEPGVDAIAFNTHRSLFRDARMRRAAAYALDRRALAAVYAERPSDGVVPAAMVIFSSAFSSASRRPSVRRRGSAPSSRRAQGQFFRTSGSERPADRQVAPALADAQSVAHALEVASFCVYAAP